MTNVIVSCAPNRCGFTLASGRGIKTVISEKEQRVITAPSSNANFCDIKFQQEIERDRSGDFITRRIIGEQIENSPAGIAM